MEYSEEETKDLVQALRDKKEEKEREAREQMNQFIEQREKDREG